MHKLLERLDASTSTLVPLLYLAGLMLGAISYFAGITLNLGLAVGIALATAAELHSFLQQRRVRATYARLQRLADTDTEYEIVQRQFKVNTWLLVGLLAFSGINAIAFAAETWTPVPGPLWFRWAQIGFRGLIIPAFFFAAGFLAPLHSDASDQLQSTSNEMLRRTLKAIQRQWRGRLKRVERSGADLAPVAIALLQETGDYQAAKHIALISQGLTSAEAGDNAVIEHLLTTPATTPAPIPQPAPQPAAARSNHDLRRAALAQQMDTRLEEYDPTEAEADDWATYHGADDLGAYGDDLPGLRLGHPTHPRGASLSNHASARNGSQAARMAPRGAELVLPLDLPPSRYEREGDSEECRRVFRVLDDDENASHTTVMKRAGVSEGTARKYRPLWNERRSKRGKRRAAPRTEEMKAVTPEMLATR